MITDDEVEQVFQSLGAQIKNLEVRGGAFAAHGNIGCLLMLASVMAVIAFAGMMPEEGAASSWMSTWWSVPASVFSALACFVVGGSLWRRWAKHNDELMLETDATLTRPLVELLVPGASFSRPRIIVSGWHPSLLIAEEDGASGIELGQIDGCLLGQTAVIAELESPVSWIVRVELPFGIAGHLRIRSMAHLGPGRSWSAGFEKHSVASKRLGAGYSIDSAPQGTGLDKSVVTPPKLVPIEALFSNALFDQLRAHPDINVAVVGCALWIVLPRAIRAFQGRVASQSELRAWKQAAKAMRDVQGVVREVLAAGEGATL